MWTVLVYANGNNELEPEIWHMIQILQEVETDHVQVVVQVARAQRTIVQGIRGDEIYESYTPGWTGIQRGCIRERQLLWEEALPSNTNMAAPETLRAFLTWGIRCYPAERYGVVVGGHVYQFVGIAPDFTQGRPYILGFPELAEVLYSVCKEEKIQFETLLLDTCYASTFEVLCEFAKHDFMAIKEVLTYSGVGPLRGFPYKEWLGFLERHYNESNEVVLTNFINSQNQTHLKEPLVAIKMDVVVLRLCKQYFSEIATCYLADEKHQDYTPYTLINERVPSCPWTEAVTTLQVVTQLLILAKSQQAEGIIPISVLYDVLRDPQRQRLYQRLFFTQANAWTQLICGKNYSMQCYEGEDTSNGIVLSSHAVHAFIANMNSHRTEKEQQQLAQTFIAERKWHLL